MTIILIVISMSILLITTIISLFVYPKFKKKIKFIICNKIAKFHYNRINNLDTLDTLDINPLSLLSNDIIENAYTILDKIV